MARIIRQLERRNWHQALPEAMTEAEARARARQVLIRNWMTHELKRTVTVELDQGNERVTRITALAAYAER